MTTTIRLVTPADSPQILAIYNPIIRDTAISFEYDLLSNDAMAERITKYTAQYPWLVCAIDGQIAGYAYGSQHRGRTAYQWSVEVSAYVHADYRGRSIATGLYMALFELLIQQGYFAAYAGIGLPNDASLALHQRLGFTSIGVFHNIGYKFGAWHDVSWWEKQLQPPVQTPSDPIPIGQITTLEDAFTRGLALIRGNHS